MPTPTRFAAPLRLLARWLGRGGRRPRRAPEPADMGTAFGMEQWLDEADTLPAALTPAPAAARRWWSLRRATVRALPH